MTMIVGFSPTMTETLRDYVRRVRSEKNLSTGDVQARSLNAISDAYVSQIENGVAKNPSPEKLIALAKGLGVVEDEVFRVARGLPPESDDLIEMMAETFGGHDLSHDDWKEIEAVIKAMVAQKKAKKG
jgi:transcriptional regulator with XRE-family HTH domain